MGLINPLLMAYNYFCSLSNDSIPIIFQNLGISQSQRSRFSPLKAASYRGDRSDGEGIKDRDAGEEKNQVLEDDRYKSENSNKSFLKTCFPTTKTDLQDFFLLALVNGLALSIFARFKKNQLVICTLALTSIERYLWEDLNVKSVATKGGIALALAAAYKFFSQLPTYQTHTPSHNLSQNPTTTTQQTGQFNVYKEEPKDWVNEFKAEQIRHISEKTPTNKTPSTINNITYNMLTAAATSIDNDSQMEKVWNKIEAQNEQTPIHLHSKEPHSTNLGSSMMIDITDKGPLKQEKNVDDKANNNIIRFLREKKPLKECQIVEILYTYMSAEEVSKMRFTDFCIKQRFVSAL